VAKIEPIAIVLAKSMGDIFANVLRPAILVITRIIMKVITLFKMIDKFSDNTSLMTSMRLIFNYTCVFRYN